MPYELLNAGEAPRALLRYAIADGTTTTSTISLKVTPREKGASTVSISGLEKMELKAVFGPAEVDENEIGYNFESREHRVINEDFELRVSSTTTVQEAEGETQ